MYTTIRIIRKIIYTAAERGGNVSRLCNAAGILEADLRDADKRVSGPTPIISLWKEVIASTKDHHFGLHLGEVYNPSTLGQLGYLLQSCRTIQTAYEALQHNQELLSGWISYAFAVSKSECTLSYHVNPAWGHTSPETARQALDMAMSGSLTMHRILTDKTVIPLRAELSFSKQASKSEYERIFQCPVYLNKKNNHIIFSRGFADTPLLNHDESLYVYFAGMLQALSRQIGDHQGFVKHIERTIIQDFQGQVPGMAIIAAHLNLSPRTFQRKLKDENESYRSLATKLKKQLALRLLENPTATLSGISEVLGYAESSSFHRAFKNWTNTTPGSNKA